MFFPHVYSFFLAASFLFSSEVQSAIKPFLIYQYVIYLCFSIICIGVGL